MLCFTPPNTLACRHAGNSWFPPAKILYQNTICKFFYMKMFAPAENKRHPRDADNLSLRFENVCISRRGVLFYCTSFGNLHGGDYLLTILSVELFCWLKEKSYAFLLAVGLGTYPMLAELLLGIGKEFLARICEINRISVLTMLFYLIDNNEMITPSLLRSLNSLDLSRSVDFP